MAQKAGEQLGYTVAGGAVGGELLAQRAPTTEQVLELAPGEQIKGRPLTPHPALRPQEDPREGSC